MDTDTRALQQQLDAANERIRDMQMEIDHLVASIPGGITICQLDGDRCIPTYRSDGVYALTGDTRADKEDLDVFDRIYAPDRERVLAAGRAALTGDGLLDIFFRIRRRDGSLGWIHLSGRRMEPSRFYAVLTGMSAESRLFQHIADETADGIYVIDRENHELLYTNESKSLFTGGKPCIGQTCYAALHGKTAPCDFCTLNRYGADGEEHEIAVDGTDRVYTARLRETNWNGIPAYIQYIRDVTEEVHTRREKERLEMYFQTIVEALPGGISVMRIGADGQPSMEYISSGVAAMTHMTLEETERLYTEDICGGVHPDDRAGIHATLAAFLEKGEGPCELRGRMRLGDGGYIWVKSTLSMLRSTDGIRRLYSVYTDISKTVEDNERLRRQYEDLILEHYRTPGPDELILGHCNITQNTIHEIRDYTGADLLGRLGRNREVFFTGLADFIVDERERRAFLDTYRNAPALAAFARKDTEHIQTCFVQLPGQAAGRYVQFKMSLIAAPGSGDVTGILTVTDITDQTISERVLNQLSVTTHDYIVDVDLLTDAFKVLSSNQNAYLVPEATGCHSARTAYMAGCVIVPKDRERYAKALDAEEMRRRLQEENAYTVTYSLADENGDIRTKNMTVFAIDMRLGRVCLVCTDITDSVRALEDALALAKKASQAKSDFLATMSHDIRTPMNAIMGMTTLAMAYLDDRNRVEDCLRKIEVANRHLLSLVNDVLDMSRIEHSRIAMNLRPLSLSVLIDGIAAIIEPQARDAGLQFAVRKQGIRTDAFSGDSLRMSQVLINLLSNAVKFTPEGGRVELLAEEIPALDSGARVRYRFTVRDTGIGMSEDFLHHVFDPFARETTATRIEGTGLGLSITKGLVERMGGTIAVESHVNQGTVFRLELEFACAEDPAIAGDAGGADDAPPVEHPFAGRTFLIAEDHPINAELLYQLLKMDGAQAHITADGDQAVQAFAHAAPGTYDAILMDIQMPTMTGYEATRAIRALDRADAAAIPIVAMTANAFAEDVQAALHAGMDAHVAKPIDVDVLRSTLSQVLAADSGTGGTRR